MVDVQPAIYKIFKIAALDKIFRFFDNEGEGDPGNLARNFLFPGAHRNQSRKEDIVDKKGRCRAHIGRQGEGR